MSWLLVLAGVGAILVSGLLTGSYARRNAPWIAHLDAGDRADALNEMAGTGVVPKWVSHINLMGWGLLVIGLILIFV